MKLKSSDFVAPLLLLLLTFICCPSRARLKVIATFQRMVK